nr:hypothetical protein [uncultured Albidiferax sp.]
MSRLVDTVMTTPANEADVEHVADLRHGKEEHVWADSGFSWWWHAASVGCYCYGVCFERPLADDRPAD